MKRISKITVVLLLVLALMLQMSPITLAADSDVATPTGYTSAEDVEYVTVSGTVVNWGAREEDCTFLSSYAESYYTDSYSWDVLSQKDGGTNTSDAYTSELYKALQTMMQTEHTNIQSYQETRPYYCYTDCVRNDYSQICSFYSGKLVNGVWDSGKTYNREHIWPNSKCLNTNKADDSADIMMLRATISSENGSRGNKAYGESSGYFDPGVSVRGDCARMFLYGYVRWGNVNGNGKKDSNNNPYTTWGTYGVMEDLETLLRWMEEDPVDTWEMGRNDAIESITGVRNVFVDYPEYAWLLFGQEMPEDMTTPSGIAADISCSHANTEFRYQVVAACTEDGYSGDTYCTNCGEMICQGKIIPARGHSYVEGTCKNCGEADPDAEPVNALVLGNNELVSAEGVSGEYSYVAEQSGTLYFTVRYYQCYGNDFGESILELPFWSQLLINGEAITSFRQTLEVTQGDVITVVLTSDSSPYTVGLHLSYEGFYEEPLGSERNPIHLSVAQCPTQTVTIPAGGTVWYQLDEDFHYGTYCLTVKGENAYIYCDDVDGLAWNVTDYYYYAENGTVTFAVYYTDMIQIGNSGDTDATFTLDAYILEESSDMTEGDNTVWLPRNTNGHYFYWTAQEGGTVTIQVTGENWLFLAGVVADRYDEIPGETFWAVEGAANNTTFTVSAGDLVAVYITTLDAEACNPGGALNVNLAFEPDVKILQGDVNGDGKLDTTDAKLIMQYDLGMVDETALVLAAADVNGDGNVDTTDAKLIMQLDLGIITEFPKVEE